MWISKMNKIAQIQRFRGSEFVIVSDFMFNTHFKGPFGDQLALLFNRPDCISKAVFLQIPFGLDFFVGFFIFRIHLLNFILFLLLFFLFPFYLNIFQHKLRIASELFIIVIFDDGLVVPVKFREEYEIEIGCAD